MLTGYIGKLALWPDGYAIVGQADIALLISLLDRKQISDVITPLTNCLFS